MAGKSDGRPSIYPTLLYADAKAAIRQLTEALGFTELSVYEGEDGAVVHAELAQGNGAVMLGSKGTGSAFDRIPQFRRGVFQIEMPVLSNILLHQTEFSPE